MQADQMQEQRVIEKLRQLVPEQMLLVENFIDSLKAQNSDAAITLAAAKLSEAVLQQIWDNQDDAEYDKL